MKMKVEREQGVLQDAMVYDVVKRTYLAVRMPTT